MSKDSYPFQFQGHDQPANTKGPHSLAGSECRSDAAVHHSDHAHLAPATPGIQLPPLHLGFHIQESDLRAPQGRQGSPHKCTSHGPDEGTFAGPSQGG